MPAPLSPHLPMPPGPHLMGQATPSGPAPAQMSSHYVSGMLGPAQWGLGPGAGVGSAGDAMTGIHPPLQVSSC